jgi:hypothetical protein
MAGRGISDVETSGSVVSNIGLTAINIAAYHIP